MFPRIDRTQKDNLGLLEAILSVIGTIILIPFIVQNIFAQTAGAATAAARKEKKQLHALNLNRIQK